MTRSQAARTCALLAAAAIFSAALVAGAILVPAPAGAVPFVVAISIGFPILAAWELPGALSVLDLRRGGADRRALAEWRRHLSDLPETEHPLGH